MTGQQRVAVGVLAVLKHGVVCVDVETVFAGNERERAVDILHQLGGGACRTGIIAGRLNAAVKRGGALKAAHIVALPAVHRDGSGKQGGYCLFGVDAECGITLARGFVDHFIVHWK